MDDGVKSFSSVCVRRNITVIFFFSSKGISKGLNLRKRGNFVIEFEHTIL